MERNFDGHHRVACLAALIIKSKMYNLQDIAIKTPFEFYLMK